MHPHHSQSIQNVTDYFQRDPEVLALLLGGSIAHGFEIPTSDVDIIIFVSDEDYKKRFAENRVHFFNMELTTYEGGYVDGKYSTRSFVERVTEKGSEPARFAFAGSECGEFANTAFVAAQGRYPSVVLCVPEKIFCINEKRRDRNFSRGHGLAQGV